jgi:hypothetical protein
MSQSEIKTWLHHYQDESDAAFLLCPGGEEPDSKKRRPTPASPMWNDATELWAKLLRKPARRAGGGRSAFALNARLMAWVGRRLGPGYLLPLLLREEGREVKGYIDLHRESRGEAARAVSLTLAKESAEHAGTLAGMTGASAEPWHQTRSGGFLRNVVYGFNDGLTANFGLVAGVIGANFSAHVVLISGVAGMIADALSMGASGYLAAKSEQEVYAHEIAMEQRSA